MRSIETLRELCSDLERELNDRGEVPYARKVELFSGWKPSNYYLPQMHIGSTKTIPKDVTMAWFVELYVDGAVLFREVHVPSKEESLEIVEGFMASRILRHIFTFGVISTKQYMEDMRASTKEE